MSHSQNDQGSRSSQRRAVFIAPLAIFPVALVFVIANSLLTGDIRTLIVSPFVAVFLAAGGYPIAVAVCWMICRYVSRLLLVNISIALLVGFELSFWLLIHPFWKRDFSDVSCAVLVAGFGLATALAFHRLVNRHQDA